MPYWDWAQGIKTGPVPDVFLSTTIMITNTTGMSVVIDNPLFSYKFHPLPDGFHGKVSEQLD
jgi:tyrosinase